MKKPFLFAALFFVPLAIACPDLKGKYFCSFPDGEGARLTIEQWEDPVTDRVMNYTFSYLEDNPYIEPIKFSDIGVMDPFGWMNRCEGEVLVSSRLGRAQISKIYLKQGRLIRNFNGRVAMTCAAL